MIVEKLPVPKWLRPYDDRPLTSYKIFMKYHGHHCKHPKRLCSGHCALILRTYAVSYDGIATVQGCISLQNYSASELELANYVPKNEIKCQMLTYLVSHYIASGGLYRTFFEDNMLTNIKNQLFSANIELVSVINGYNKDDTLDKVSVNMDLFKPVNVPVE